MLRVEDMTIEQKIGHVMCACYVYRQPGDFEFIIDLLKKKACTCIRLSARKSSAQEARQFREAAGYPLLIITDMEQGYTPSGRQSIPMLTLAACANHEYTKAFAAAVASDGLAAGYTGCWSPVVDILRGNAPASVSRKAGDSPERVFEFAKDICEVFESYNFAITGKHYPGGGTDEPLDTHIQEGVCSLTEQELLDYDLVPYLKLWKLGLMPSIMTRHCVFPKIDPDYPASLSKKVIDVIKRQGYDGLIYTDSLAMMGIMQKYGEAESMALALEAGNDLVMPNCRRTVKELYEMMLDNYKKGLISDDRLDAAVRKVLETAERYDKKPENPYPVPENIDEILNNIARDSITALCDDGVSTSIPVDDKRLFIVMSDMDYDGVSEEIALGKWYSPARVKKAIKERFPNADIETIKEYADARDNERVLYAATAHKEVVFVTFCTTGAYMGTDCLTRRSEAVINSLVSSGKLSTIVHFGNPLALENIKHVPRRIFGYLAPEAQVFAFDVLCGNIPAKGKNPFPKFLK